MKKLIATVTLSFLMFGSSSLSLISPANASSPTAQTLEEITTETTFPTNPQPNLDLSQTTDEIQVAYVDYVCDYYYWGGYIIEDCSYVVY